MDPTSSPCYDSRHLTWYLIPPWPWELVTVTWREWGGGAGGGGSTGEILTNAHTCRENALSALIISTSDLILPHIDRLINPPLELLGVSLASVVVLMIRMFRACQLPGCASRVSMAIVRPPPPPPPPYSFHPFHSKFRLGHGHLLCPRLSAPTYVLISYLAGVNLFSISVGGLTGYILIDRIVFQCLLVEL